MVKTQLDESLLSSYISYNFNNYNNYQTTNPIIILYAIGNKYW
jgi:hypothetical protein